MIEDRTGKLLDALEPGHPVVPWGRGRAAAYLQKHGVKEYNAFMERRNEAIRLELSDPYNYGVELSIWKLADVIWGWITWEQFIQDPIVPVEWKECKTLERWIRDYAPIFSFLIAGGNRASKTEYICKRIVQAAMRYERATIWLFHENYAMSVKYHHSLIHKYLPIDVKNTGKTEIGYVSWSLHNGFSGDKVTFPNAAEIEFKTYESRPKSLEGGNLGDPRKRPCPGAVGDEAMPWNFFDTLKYRCTTNRALRLNGYTAIDGSDDITDLYLSGKTDLLSGDALIPEVTELLPLVSRDVTNTLATAFFHSRYNPYNPLKNLQKDVMTEPREKRIVRMAGLPFKRRDMQFPKYKPAIHQFPLERLPKIGTRYVFDDPAGTKNHFIIWVLTDVYERYWVYREWPCVHIPVPGVGRPEPWAITGGGERFKFGGQPGGGSKPFGMKLLDYKNEFARLEGWWDLQAGNIPLEEMREVNGADEVIYGRFMDAKFANTPRDNAYETTTLLEEFAEIGMMFESIAGTGRTESDVQLVNDLLGYTDEWYTAWQAKQLDPSVSLPINGGPRLFICDQCENVDFALKQFTGEGGTKEATKDPIDCLKFLACAQPGYVDESRKRMKPGVRGYGGPSTGQTIPGDALDKKRQIFAQAKRQAQQSQRRRY